MTAPLFTVFTPTYNRAGTLPRVYDSLRAQTLKDFEWLIVDDGSEDGTKAMVRAWMADAGMPIRYIHQDNQGKAAAVNRGVGAARGELFLVLDSDDTCTRDALERLREIWVSIPESLRHTFSGVTVHCFDGQGRIVGDRFPADPLDAHPYELMRVRGEKWGCHRTEILRAFPYPIVTGERYLPEGIVWNRVGREYLIRFRNVALRRYTPAPGGITAGVRTLLMRNPRGAAQYYRDVLALPVPVRWLWRPSVQYGRYALHAGRSPVSLAADAPRRGLVALCLPLAAIAWLVDRLMAGWHGTGARPFPEQRSDS